MRIHTIEAKSGESFIRVNRSVHPPTLECCTWECRIEDGPWYDDSDPCGTGNSEQEAIDDVFVDLIARYQEIREFLQEHNRLPE